MPKQAGMLRLLLACRHSYSGIRHALAHDPAIRQVSVAVVLLSALSTLLPMSIIEHLVLLLFTMQLLLVEFINSALEAAVDRIGLEHHPLSALAKDLGSVAVGFAVLMCGLCWLVIAGPVFMVWVRRLVA